jgi:hypothetical protein
LASSSCDMDAYWPSEPYGGWPFHCLLPHSKVSSLSRPSPAWPSLLCPCLSCQAWLQSYLPGRLPTPVPAKAITIWS